MVEEGASPSPRHAQTRANRAQSGEQIPNSLRIWRFELEARIGEVPRGRPVVVYCA